MLKNILPNDLSIRKCNSVAFFLQRNCYLDFIFVDLFLFVFCKTTKKKLIFLSALHYEI